MSLENVNPTDLGRAVGFSHGMLQREDGRVLFIAGQIGVQDFAGSLNEWPLVSQFGEALRRVLRVVEEAGGAASDVGRMTIYVTDIDQYRNSRGVLGPVWKTWMGDHYPAMALVEVKALLDPKALVEIEATAVIGGLVSGD